MARLAGHAPYRILTLPPLPSCLPASPRCLPLQGPYRAVGQALEVIPRTLAQNCGANVIRTLTKLRAKHADAANCTYGINGEGWRGQVAGKLAAIRSWRLAPAVCTSLSTAPHLPTDWPALTAACLPGLACSALLCLSRPPSLPQATAAQLWT